MVGRNSSFALNRLEAFSDGVFAILITIMVLSIHTPTGHHFSDLSPLRPVLLSELPEMSVGIGEEKSSHSPRSINWSIY